MPRDYFSVCLPGIPRTKKNHGNVFPMISLDKIRLLVDALKAGLELNEGAHKACIRALMNLINFSVHPSDAYQEWFDRMYLYRTSIQDQVTKLGFTLPITDPVYITATFYRERLSGDWSGFTQALGDCIQAEQWKCKVCGSKTYKISDCRKCTGKMSHLEHSRKGLGLIADDGQIVHWDGTRLDKDAKRPRVEFRITILKPVAPQMGLPLTETESEQEIENVDVLS